MIETENVRNDYIGNGTTSEYDFTFKILDESHLLVTISIDGAETELDLNIDYTVDGVGESGGGSITLVDLDQTWIDSSGFLDDDISLDIIRNVPLTQTTDIKNQGRYFPETHENEFDYLTMIAQQLNDSLQRSLKVAVTDFTEELILPSADERAGNFLAFDAEGNLIAALPTFIDPDDVVITPYIETLLDDVNAQAARITLGFAGSGGTVQAANIEADAVTTAKILNLAVTTAKLAANAVTLAKMDTGFINDMTAATLAYDDYVSIADTSASNVVKKALASEFRNLSIRSVTGTDTATAADNTLLQSSTSHTQNLFTVSGNEGKVIHIIHDGTSLTQLYTIDPASSEVIIDENGSHSTLIMYTKGEIYSLQATAAGWRVINHRAVVISQTYDPTITGSGTVTAKSFWWSRYGNRMKGIGTFKTGTVAAAAVTVSLPGGLTYRTAGLPPDLTGRVGTWYGNVNTTAAATPDTTKGIFPLTYRTGTSTSALLFAQDVDLDDDVTGSIFRLETGSGMSSFANTTQVTVDWDIEVTEWNP